MDNKVIIAIVAVVAVVAIVGGIAFATGGSDSDKENFKDVGSDLPDDAFDNFDGTVLVSSYVNNFNFGLAPTAAIMKMDSKDTLKIELKSDNGIVYSWEMKGAASTQEGYEERFEDDRFNIDSPVFDTEEKALKIDIRYKGVLPFPANVKYFVGDSFENGEEISVHNYYESVKDIDLGTFVVQNGYVEFTLTEC